MAPEAGAGAAGLVLRGVSRTFGRREVVRSVDLEARPGRVTGLLGPNGAGKTTIFRIVIGLLRPTAGSVHLDGRDITRMPVHRRARQGLGYLAQAPSIFRGMTVRENLLAALELAGRARGERAATAARLIEETGLTWRAPKATSPRTLLHGAIRRMVINVLTSFEGAEPEYRDKPLGAGTIRELVAFQITPFGRGLLESVVT